MRPSGVLTLRAYICKCLISRSAQAKNSRKSQSQDEDGALADKLPEDMVAKVADMLSNVLGNGKL